MTLTRRDVVRGGVLGAATLVGLEAFGVTRPSGATSAARRAAASSPFTPFRAELPIPRVLRPTRRTATTDFYDVTMRETERELLPGYRTPVLAYDGTVPGPTIHARAGRRVVVRQRNALGMDANVHLHGARAPASSDGHPKDIVPAGSSRLYTYPNRQDGATLWYHDHTHHHTAEMVYRGLSAFYLLHDERERELELPRGRHDIPLMIQDKSFNADGSLRYVQDINSGFVGDTILVNGAVSPRLRVERRRYRLRLLNASNAREYELELGDGTPFVQIAGDGGLLPRPVRQRRIVLAAAERIEVIVDFSDHRPGTELVLRNRRGTRGTAAVMRFDVARGESDDLRPLPRVLRPRERVPRPTASHAVVLDRVLTPRVEWQMNGRGFDMERIDHRSRLGSTEVWRFINRSHHTHPMHLHGFFFRVLARNARRPPHAERGWKDTVRVQPGETVTVLPHFTGYPGAYVFHCHVLEHGDHSMMNQLEVLS